MPYGSQITIGGSYFRLLNNKIFQIIWLEQFIEKARRVGGKRYAASLRVSRPSILFAEETVGVAPPPRGPATLTIGVPGVTWPRWPWRRILGGRRFLVFAVSCLLTAVCGHHRTSCEFIDVYLLSFVLFLLQFVIVFFFVE